MVWMWTPWSCGCRIASGKAQHNWFTALSISLWASAVRKLRDCCTLMLMRRKPIDLQLAAGPPAPAAAAPTWEFLLLALRAPMWRRKLVHQTLPSMEVAVSHHLCLSPQSGTNLRRSWEGQWWPVPLLRTVATAPPLLARSEPALPEASRILFSPTRGQGRDLLEPCSPQRLSSSLQ